MALNIPFWIYDIYSTQLITTPQIPTDIRDSKNIVLAESIIPGLNFSPISAGGMGNRKISFTLPLIKRNGLVGNILMLKQFDNLRNQAFEIGAQLFSAVGQFSQTPKVLFMWGSGSTIPLEYYVAKCDFVHKSSFVNRLGYTQYTEVEMELWLDEVSPIYQAEELVRKITSYAGMVLGGVDLFGNNLKDGLAKSGQGKFGIE